MSNEANEKGFTLFEMVVSTMLFGIIITLVWNVFFTGYNNYRRVTYHNQVLEEMRGVTSQIDEAIKRAERVELDYVWDTDLGNPVRLDREGELKQQEGKSPLLAKLTFKSQGMVTEVIEVSRNSDEMYQLVYDQVPALPSKVEMSTELESIQVFKSPNSDQVELVFIKQNTYDEQKPHEYRLMIDLKYKWN